MDKMGSSVLWKACVLAILGFGYHAYGACIKVYGNFNLASDIFTCYEIYGNNITFNGNGHTVYGNPSQSSNIVINVMGTNNVTVKNVTVDCNTKSTGIEFDNAGSSNATDIMVKNCYVGVQKSNTNLNVVGLGGGTLSNMINNSMDVNSFDGTSTYIYTSYLDGYNNGTGFGVHVDTSPYYDYNSVFYLKNVGLLANNNSFFWLDHTYFFANTSKDLMLYNIPAAYLSSVYYTTSTVYNTTVYKL